MFRRVSSNFLLKSVILVVGIALVAVLATGAWDAWRSVGTAIRLERIAETNTYVFSAMHNLRFDRSLGSRALGLDGVVDAGQIRQITQSREA
jgi:hypothetical protein